MSKKNNNDKVYRFISPLLYKKRNKSLDTTIKNFSEKYFRNKKLIIIDIYLKDNSDKLVGITEIFDYKKRENKITIGNRVNEDYRNKRIASNTLKLIKR